MKLTLSGRVVLMMGTSGSGKSTLAKALATRIGAVLVSYDAHQRRIPGDMGADPVGGQALASAYAELDAHLAAGTPVVVDGTHCQAQRRRHVVAAAAAHGLETVVIVLLVPLAVCLRRQRHRVRQVPARDIARQHAEITAALPDLADEGHSAVLLLSPADVDQALADVRTLIGAR